MMIAILPLLLLAAAGDPPAAGEAARGPMQVFIAPSGEPFRAQGDAPYPVAAWFAGADKNGDGKLDSAEFAADFLRFFDTLDQNHDGAIDSVEKARYENEVVPETLGGSWYPKSQAQTNAEWNSSFGEDVNLPHVDRPSRDSREVPIGAARFDLLGLPEPVAAMDLEVRGRISRRMAGDVAQMRFNQLDPQHRGYLTLDQLPRTPAEGGGRKRR
jgi:hypothetical protein